MGETAAWEILGKITNGLPPAYRVDKTLPDGFFASRGRVSPVHRMRIMVSVGIFGDGKRWVHLSASYPDKLPSYEDLVVLKAVFFGPAAKAIQVFPAKSEHVNVHPYCLHLWHCVDGDGLPDFTVGTGMI